MEFTTHYADRNQHITDLFRATFTASEGAAEGDAIESFVERLFARTDATDMFVFVALQADALCGAAIFTRIRYPEDPRSVFLLSPMAVATEEQGKKTGQRLLVFSLNTLRQNAVDVALTYGDINFYSRVGFRQVSESTARPPLPLNHPEAWLGQSLTGEQIDPLKGRSTCVDALNDPALW